MAYRCDTCDRDFSSEESLNQHNSSKHPVQEKKGKTSFKKYFIFIIISLILVLSTLTVYSSSKKPGELDDFATCLNEAGVVVYGNDFCSYTTTQLGFFGKSRHNLNYVKCADDEALCNEKNIRTTPTWEHDGEFYVGVQGIEKLASITGCPL